MLDATLMTEFRNAVAVLHPDSTTEVIARVHKILATKIYNARSNEFLRTISKLECIKEKKVVDVNVGLRDSLKSFVVKKQSGVYDHAEYIS